MGLLLYQSFCSLFRLTWILIIIPFSLIPVIQRLNNWGLAPVVQTLDSAIHRINHYPLDSVIDFRNTYPLDSDLSGG